VEVKYGDTQLPDFACRRQVRRSSKSLESYSCAAALLQGGQSHKPVRVRTQLAQVRLRGGGFNAP